MSQTGSISVLVEHLKAGRDDAAEQLWRTYYPRLVALAAKKLRGTPKRIADEEDIVLSALDSFCRAAEGGRFPKLGDRDGLWQLLVVITERKAINQVNFNNRIRRGGGQVRGDSAVMGSADSPGFDGFSCAEPTPAEAAHMAEEFQGLLLKLGDDRLRDVAVWKMEGYSNAEIAQKIGRSVVTVERELGIIREILGKP